MFINLEENTDYVYHIRAHTSQGAGPYSEKVTVHTERDIIRAPMSVQAVATSDQSVEVWWEPVPSRGGKVVGYQVCILMCAKIIKYSFSLCIIKLIHCIDNFFIINVFFGRKAHEFPH